MRVTERDVVIVGAGGAGLRAAIAAKELVSEARVCLITKGELGRSGVTATACSDRMAFHCTLPTTEPGGPDNWKEHARDIYEIGGRVSDGNLAAILAKGSQAAFEYLQSLGVPFVMKDGVPHQFVTDGSKYARACYTGPYTANHIEEALLRRFRQLGIEVLDRHFTIGVAVGNGEVAGVWVVPEESSDQADIFFVAAPAVVLACGGAGELYEVNVYPPAMTGDGYAMALKAGAELVNMEFIQIGISSVKTKLACSGSMMRAIPRLVDARGDEILPSVIPDPVERCSLVFRKGASWPVSNEEPSHAIDVAVFKKIGDGGRVFLDYASNPVGFDPEGLPETIVQRYAAQGVNLLAEPYRSSPLERLEAINPQAVRWLRERGVDLRRGERVEIAPAIQHFQGGVKINEQAETCVKGLFAAGETAGGQHGANRPGGNALLDTQVFGRIAGESAARRACNLRVQLAEEPVLHAEFGSVSPSAVRDELRRLMTRAGSVIRCEQTVMAALRRVAELSRQSLALERSIAYTMETYNMILSACAVLNAILARKESRGPHLFYYRDDLPAPRRDPEWQRYIVLSLRGGALQLEARKPTPLCL